MKILKRNIKLVSPIDKMLSFKNNQEVFNYSLERFSKKSSLILVRGSTAYKPARKFSDFDIEVWGKSAKKPYYEIVLLNKHPVLISIYFYKYSQGRKANPPKNVRILSGKYNHNIKPDFSKDRYTNKERIKRECQLVMDFFFKYLRCEDKIYLEAINKRIN